MNNSPSALNGKRLSRSAPVAAAAPPGIAPTSGATIPAPRVFPEREAEPLPLICAARAAIPTRDGRFELLLYESPGTAAEHLALVHGEVAGRADVLVRVHSECFTGDVLGSQRCDCGEQLERAMRLLAAEGAGVILYLRQEGRGIGLKSKLRAYNLQDQGYDTVDANLLLGHGADERDYGIAAAILRDLGIGSVRLLTNNPAKIEALEGLGIRVTERLALVPRLTPENMHYLQTKARRMRHLLFAGTDLEIGGGGLPAADAAAAAGDPGTDTAGAAVGAAIARLRDRFPAHRQRLGRPFVTLTYAQSLDGCIAAERGQPMPLSGRAALRMTHQLRAAHEAILIGVGTLLSDDPSLTVRHVSGPHPQPVVLDSRLRTPPTARLLRHPAHPLLIATTDAADPERQAACEAAGAHVIRLPPDEQGRVSIAALLHWLHERGIGSVMVEGGARVITSFLRSRRVDHVLLTLVSTFIGGLRAVGPLAPEGSDLAAVPFPRLGAVETHRLEADLVVSGEPLWQAP